MKELEAIQELVDRWQDAAGNRTDFECAMELKALLPSLREPMACGHPRACWQATKPDSVDAVVGYRCVACELQSEIAALKEQHRQELDRQTSHWVEIVKDQGMNTQKKIDKAVLEESEAILARWNGFCKSNMSFEKWLVERLATNRSKVPQ